MDNIGNNPWAGLSAYQDPKTCSSPLKFCGRDNDSYDVTQLIDDNILITLYGKSGVGKTSLLNAGVFPRLRSEGYLPVSIRLGIDATDVSFQKCILSRLSQCLEDNGYHTITYDVNPLPENEQSQEYLWSYFARNHFSDTNGQSVFPVFVFDQFEEVFKNRKNDAEALLRQLNYLMDDSHALSDRIVDGKNYTYDFNYRFVLSIREDDLYSLEDSIDNNYLTDMKRCRYRLRSMTEEGARDAIVQPGEGLFDEDEKEQIVRDIITTARSQDDNSISTNVLSLICSRLYLESRKNGLQQITAQLVSNYLAGNPFEKYYNEATTGFSNKEKSYIERNFIDSSGRRNSISESDFFLHVKNGEALLNGPQKILQRISISSDSKDNRIELIHDSFCAPLAELKQKRKLRRRLYMIFICLCIAAISIGTAALIFYQKEQVDDLNAAILENNSRLVSEKASMMIAEGDVLDAIKFLLNVPYTKNVLPETEKALNAAYDSLYSDYACIGILNHDDDVTTAEYSKDAKQIITACNDGICRIWNSYSGEKLKELESNIKGMTSASLSNDGSRAIASFSNGIVLIWDVATGEIVDSLKRHAASVNYACFSPNGEYAISASDDSTVILWNAHTGDFIKTIVKHKGKVNCALFNNDGSKVITASEDGTSAVYDFKSNTSKIIFTSKDHSIEYAEFNDDDDTKIAVVTNNEVFIIQGDKVKSIRDKDNIITSATFSPDGHTIATSSYDKTIKLYNIDTCDIIHTYTGHSNIVKDVVFSPDGRFVLSTSRDNEARIWNTEVNDNSTIIHCDMEYNVSSVTYSPDGRYIAAISSKGETRIWNAETRDVVKSFSIPGLQDPSIAFNKNANKVVVASDGNLSVLDFTQKPSSSPLEVANDITYYYAMFADDDQSVIAFSPYQRTANYTINNHSCNYLIDTKEDSLTCLTLLPGDSTCLLASASSCHHNTFSIWNFKTNESLKTFEGHTKKINTLQYSHDGKRIISGSSDNKALIWDFETGDVIHAIKRHTSEVYFAEFSCDDRYAITASTDQTIRLWNTENGEEVAIRRSSSTPLYTYMFSPKEHKYIILMGKTIRIYKLWSPQDLMSDFSSRYNNKALSEEERKFYSL